MQNVEPLESQNTAIMVNSMKELFYISIVNNNLESNSRGF